MLTRRSSSLRSRVWLGLVVSVIIATAVITLAFNVLFAMETSSDVNRELTDRAELTFRLVSASPAGVRVTDSLAADQTPLEWVYAAHGSNAAHTNVLRPKIKRAAQSAADSLARSSDHYRDVGDDWIRLHRATRTIRGQQVTVVSGILLTPYQRSRNIVLRNSLLLFLLIVGAAALIGRRAVTAALTPVRRMTEQVRQWSESQSINRFGIRNPHDDLSQLGWTFDRLLDRVVAGLRHEQRFSAEVSHELRTPIAALVAEAELALRRERTSDEYREAITTIHTHAVSMASTIESLTSLSVDPSRAMSSVCDPQAAVAETLNRLRAQHVVGDIRCSVRSDDMLPHIGADQTIVERMLMPIMSNACRYGATRIDVEITHGDRGVVITIDDDGTGISADETERIFEPGIRGAAGTTPDAPAGSGLGLPLARRIARIVGGDVTAEATPSGARIVVVVPTG